VRLAVAAGQDDLARDAVACLEEGARRTPVASGVGTALVARGLVARDATLLADGLEQLRQTPLRPLIARSCEDLALQLAADGERRGAQVLLQQAADLHAAIGADAHLARVSDELRRLGVRTPRAAAPRPTFGWASLTPMERTVSDLVAEGLTNPEIGARLHISRRTVESHLAHVFRKLTCTSRSQLAAEVVRRAPG
jgi:DNA-binding CsgD family transcriptional regulator